MFTYDICVRDQDSGKEISLQFENMASIESLLFPVMEELRRQNVSDSVISKLIPASFMSTIVDTSASGLPPASVLVGGQPLLEDLEDSEPDVEHAQPKELAGKKMCDVCGELLSASNLSRHKTVKHAITPPSFICGNCNKAFPTKDRLASHEERCRK